MVAEIGDDRDILKASDVVVVPRGVAHRFGNTSDKVARTFNVYAPPAYQWSSRPAVGPHGLSAPRAGNNRSVAVYFLSGEHLIAELHNMKVAVLATDGVEEVELTEPVKALKDAGAQVAIINHKRMPIQTFRHHDKGAMISVDHAIDEVNPSDYDAVLLPGGALNADRMRRDPRVIRFLQVFDKENKPIAAICHAPWELVSAGIARGRKLTSYESIQDDLRNAGAEWVDAEVVVDSNLVTSRRPADIPAFNREMIKLLSQQPPREAGGRYGQQPQARCFVDDSRTRNVTALALAFTAARALIAAVLAAIV